MQQRGYDGNARTLHVANAAVQAGAFRPMFGPSHWNIPVVRIRHAAHVTILPAKPGETWIPVRVRGWHQDKIQAAITFLGQAAARDLHPSLIWGELVQATRGALLSAIHALLGAGTDDGLVAQQTFRDFGGLVLGDDKAVRDAWDRIAYGKRQGLGGLHPFARPGRRLPHQDP